MVTLLITVVGLACLVGCGTSGSLITNDVSRETPAEELETSTKAAEGARSVTIHAVSRQGRGKFRLDLQLTRHGGKGKIKLLGIQFEVIRVGQSLYVKGPPSVYAKLGIKKQIPSDTWVQLSAQNSLGALTDIRGEAARVLASRGRLTKGATTTLRGQPVVEVKTEEGGVYIRTSGPPYPLKLEKKGHETSQITFEGWDEPVTITAPSKVMPGAG